MKAFSHLRIGLTVFLCISHNRKESRLQLRSRMGRISQFSVKCGLVGLDGLLPWRDRGPVHVAGT